MQSKGEHANYTQREPVLAGDQTQDLCVHWFATLFSPENEQCELRGCYNMIHTDNFTIILHKKKTTTTYSTKYSTF